MANPIVTFTMENGDVMKAELYPEIAPTSVNNFVNLVQKGFYDGLIFHRVIAGFMIQGGDPEGTGMGGPGYSIKGEFASNGFKNDLKHTRGVLSMARSMRPDSAGSQFFIMHQNAPHLDGDYAAFGKLIEGEEMSAVATVSTASATAAAVIIMLDMSCNNCCINKHISSVINLEVMIFRIFCSTYSHSCLGIMHHCKNCSNCNS